MAESLHPAAIHHLPPFGALAFTLGRRTMLPFLAPGTDPLTMMSPRAASVLTTSVDSSGGGLTEE